MTHVAQDAARRNAIAFIRRDPTTVSIQNRKFSTTSTGGRKYVNDGETFNEIVRIIPTQSTSEQQSVRTTPDGRTVLPNWMIVCAPETEITVGSFLYDGGTKYEVIHRARVPSWRVVFEAFQDGSG